MHPGTTVRQDCLEKNGLSVTDAARILGVDRQTLSNLLNARSGISPEMAVRLEKAFGTSAREWLIRQLDYELAEVMRRANKIKVEPFRASATESWGERMNAVEIEEAISALAEQPFDPAEFPFAFLASLREQGNDHQAAAQGRVEQVRPAAASFRPTTSISPSPPLAR